MLLMCEPTNLFPHSCFGVQSDEEHLEIVQQLHNYAS